MQTISLDIIGKFKISVLQITKVDCIFTSLIHEKCDMKKTKCIKCFNLFILSSYNDVLHEA